TRPLNDNHSTVAVHRNVAGFSGSHCQRSQLWTVRLRRGNMCRDRPVVEGVWAAGCAVDKLIAHHKVPRGDALLQRTGGTRRNDALDTDRLHRPEIGPEVNLVRGNLVPGTVSGKEGNTLAAECPEHEIVARSTVGCLDRPFFLPIKQFVEPRPAKDAYVGQ